MVLFQSFIRCTIRYNDTEEHMSIDISNKEADKEGRKKNNDIQKITYSKGQNRKDDSNM